MEQERHRKNFFNNMELGPSNLPVRTTRSMNDI